MSVSPEPVHERTVWAERTARDAGAYAHELYEARDSLQIESKGLQDFVTEADRSTEQKIRTAIARDWPEDGIVGEEYDPVAGTSGYVWVIDPIDGTANFIGGMPAWCVVLALTFEGETVGGVIFAPCSNEMFVAERGAGARRNGKPIEVSGSTRLDNGLVGAGIANRVPTQQAVRFIDGLLAQNGMFFRNASGALMLAYTASGGLIGFAEPHMNAWDCLAGLLMIEEAGGQVAPFDGRAALTQGVRVIAGGPGVYPAIKELAEQSFDPVEG